MVMSWSPNSSSTGSEASGQSLPIRRSSRIDIQLLAAPERQDNVFQNVLERRDGSVLARNTILKSEHFGQNRTSGIDLKLFGAPNFRKANLDVYGVAQPTVPGLSTLLRFLRCGPNIACSAEHSCTWFSTREEPLIYINGRPFVLRDKDSPFENIRSYAGISSTRLELMENRLKEDILAESAQNNGLILVHDEVNDHEIVPCLASVESVKTLSEVFAELQDQGFCVRYKRLPISSEQSPTDAFIDELVSIFNLMPLQDHSVIFSCGAGIGRTTYAMIIATILRRFLIKRHSQVDPFQSDLIILEEEKTTRSVLRLVSVLEQGLLANEAKKSAIEWTLARGNLIDNLKEAIQGNYQIVIGLTRVLENGIACKRAVDEAIDKCEALINLRDHILLHRVKHSVNEESNALEMGLGYLERYFSLIAFCAFLEDLNKKHQSFSQWIHERRDVWNMLNSFRRNTDKLSFFRPIEDLSALSARRKNTNITLSGGIHTRSEEIAEYNVIKSRSGAVLSSHTILKIDHWNPKGRIKSILTGAPNFRQLPSENIYATAQPTLSALQSIVGMLHERLSVGEKILWINVREEPIVYIDGEPYVLRDRYATLRNIKSFAGITADRLQLMEQRLKDDILQESSTYNNRLLVHYESSTETLYPTWLSIENECDVLTLDEIFSDLKKTFPLLEYKRLPITAEESFEPEHIDLIFDVIVHNVGKGGHIIFNCQMGASRSTLGTVIASLINNWRFHINDATLSNSNDTHHYRIVHSILRVIKNGLHDKASVDSMIEKASLVVNLKKVIEDYRNEAENSSDPNQYRRALRKGIVALRRYALIIIFQSYLDSINPDEDLTAINNDSFSKWYARHQEFTTLFHELDHKGTGIEVLNEETNFDSDSKSSDSLEVIKNRKGQVLAPMTILKFDHFPGCQKLTLPERIDGAPNFREVKLCEKTSVYGLAMPTKYGFTNVLNRIAKPALWCCLREEPVIYIKGLPYVLRITKDPVTNLEMTGIISERVEQMEERLKLEVIAELEQFGGKLLLHEENAETGRLEPIWEAVMESEVETTFEIVQDLQKSHFKITYSRIPITDEQAPMPEVFDRLLHILWNQCDLSPSLHPIFNCQMGRGRTTTGMIISVLVYLIKNKRLLSSPEQRLEDSLDGLSIEVGEESKNRYLNGEYKLITKLVTVLEHGKRAKRLIDSAIDHCADLQNLRIAIYDYKMMPDNGGVRGRNYLFRYFYLIAFAEYLISIEDGSDPEAGFSNWLSSRREITNMVENHDNVDFS